MWKNINHQRKLLDLLLKRKISSAIRDKCGCSSCDGCLFGGKIIANGAEFKKRASESDSSLERSRGMASWASSTSVSSPLSSHFSSSLSRPAASYCLLLCRCHDGNVACAPHPCPDAPCSSPTTGRVSFRPGMLFRNVHVQIIVTLPIGSDRQLALNVEKINILGAFKKQFWSSERILKG